MSDLERLRDERDLYLSLLELAHAKDIEPLLREVLALAVQVTSAARGHIHVFSDDADEVEWSIVHGGDAGEGERVRAMTSRGIEAEVVSTGKLVCTASARLDPRFESLDSVRNLEMESVMCAPVGGDRPLGVLYLHGPPNAFSESDQRLAEVLARHVGPFVRWAADEARRARSSDPTARWREQLKAERLCGSSAALARVLELIASVARLPVGVLLEGESGTGKSLIARCIHDNSERSDHSFVELNCAALPDTLIESELFGAEPGAHSTALQGREGKVAAAEGGTLFLDEIGELTLPAQAKLLQFLESREYYKLGGTTPIRADVRIIAATNADLKDMVEAKTFRQDLYHRLKIVPFRVPSLRERSDDIDALSDYFRDAAARRNDLPVLAFSARARVAIQTAAWPGNLRELSNTVEASLIRAAHQSAPEIAAHHLFEDTPRSEVEHLTFAAGMRACQKRILKDTLERTRWNVMETARQLDIARSYVYKLIKAFDLSPDD